MNLGNDIFGLIFSYPHGFDDQKEPQIDPDAIRWFKGVDPANPILRWLENAEKSTPRYLHLFNSSEAVQYVSATIENVVLKNFMIPPKKRISFILER